jgi:fructose-1,6-bisphosphatase/inositol monophosphatase family enzyme
MGNKTLGKNAHKPTFRELNDFAHAMADLTGPAVLPYFRKATPVENKDTSGAFDPVTKADRAAERVIAKALRSKFPDHTLVGEEFGTKPGTSSYRWVVDPIDGTRAFITGGPLWGTLIGLLDGDKPVLGLMDQPFTCERFWSGEAASYLRTRDGRPRNAPRRDFDVNPP